jgi:hypothetical protein
MSHIDPVGWPWLRTRAATRLIDRLWPEEHLIAERGEARPTKYLVQRKSDHFYFAAESCGVIGDVWIGNRSLAYRFDFQAIAELRILKFPQASKLFVVIPVQG